MTNEMIKRFDEKFNKPISDNVHKYLNSTDSRNVYYDNTDIKSFIQSEIDRAVAERDKEIVEMIKTVQDKIGNRHYDGDDIMTTRQETAHVVRDEQGKIIVFIAQDKDGNNIVYIPKEATA